MSSRPMVTVYDSALKDALIDAVPLPDVFTAPIRSDVVHYVHTLMRKNDRQAYAVYNKAGHETPAESWGTGRAVARIPRVPGGGTSRSGQGAFGNMCRGGRMFGPTKIWRRWHRKISVGQRRYAVSSALAATAVPALVMARGHKIDNVPELPLVVGKVDQILKTKEAEKVLKVLGANDDVDKVIDSKQVRRGVGKGRNRRYVQRKGPLIIYSKEDISQGFRNIPGVDLCLVENLSLLDLAPGGHLGRFCIWTASAFKGLDQLFGTYEDASKVKSGFTLPRTMMTNADLARIINSDEVQSIVKPQVSVSTVLPKKRNPLKNAAVRTALNPYFAEVKKREEAKSKAGKSARAKLTAAQRKAKLALKKKGKAFYTAASKEGDVKF